MFSPTRAPPALPMETSDKHKSPGQKTVEIDPDGDLRLLVGSGKEQVTFIVCSKALARSASAWKTMLYGPFKEAQRRGDAKPEWSIELPEDDPSAFEFILHLVHAQPHRTALKITTLMAFEVTVLTNKYDMTSCLWPVAKEWLQGLPKSWPHLCTGHSPGGMYIFPPQPPCTAPCYSGQGPPSGSCPLPPLAWLFITQELGDLKAYRTTLQAFVFEATSSATGIVGINEQDRSVYSRSPLLCGYDAYSPSGQAILDGLVDDISIARRQNLSLLTTPIAKDVQLLKDIVKSHHDHTLAERRYSCTVKSHSDSDSRRICDMIRMALVTLWEGSDQGWTDLQGQRPYSSPRRLCMEIHNRNWNSFLQSAREVVSKRHNQCTPFKTALPSLEDVWEAAAEVPESKLKYITQQATLSGLQRE